jgi:hypothetical protein
MLFVILSAASCTRAESPAVVKDYEELPPVKVAAGDWPWWRGPTFNGIAAEAKAPTKWDGS